MKKLIRGVQILTGIIAAVLSVLFLFIELRTVFSGDWLLHEIPVLGLMQYLFRAVLAALALLSSVCLIRKGSRYPVFCTAVSCVVLMPLIPNGFGFIFLALAVLAVLTSIPQKSAP